MTVLADPRPERIQAISGFTDGGELKVHSELIAGVTLRVMDHQGLKIVPTHEVAIEIDGKSFSVGASMARDFAASLLGFADAADQLNKVETNG